MSVLNTVLVVVQILCALIMIGLILIQHGKGADMGAAFGGGSSGSLFGASGGANFLSRATGVLAAVFFVSTLALAYVGSHRTATTDNALDKVLNAPASAAQQIPGAATPASAAAPAAVAASGAAQIPTK
jgi:preprotein translocase subunit SecG